MNKINVLFIALLFIPLVNSQSVVMGEVDSISVDGHLKLETSTFYAHIWSSSSYMRHFKLDASDMTVIMERNNGPYLQLQAESSNASAEIIYEGPGRIEIGAINENHYTTIVVDNSSATIISEGGKFTKKTTDNVTREDGYTKERQKEEFNFGPQFKIQNLNGLVVAQGTFSFTLYEWEGVIVQPDGEQSFWTGERPVPSDPMQRVPDDVPLGDVRDVGGSVEWQTAFVYVHNGTLEMGTSLERDGSYIYMGESSGVISGTMKVSADGPNSNDTNLNGNYQSTVWAPDVGLLSASVTTHVDPEALERSPTHPRTGTDPPDAGPGLAPATTSTPALHDGGLPPWSYLLAVPALLLACAAYVRPARRMKRLEDAFDLGLHAYVLQNAPPLLRSRRFGVEASMMYVVALLDEQGPDEAEAHLRNVRPASRPTGATHEYLMARIRAAQTRFDEARIHVQACLEEEPAFLVEVRQQPSLRFLTRPGEAGEGYA